MSRSQNFTFKEIHTLLTCLDSMKGLIMPDAGLGYKTLEEQRKGWEYITRVVNSAGDGDRSLKTIKSKWFDLKYRAKKKITTHRRKLKMGIETPKLKLNDIEERILKLIGKASTGRTSFSALSEVSEMEDMSEEDESSTELDLDKQHVSSSEVFQVDVVKRLTPNEDVKTKDSSTERVRRHRLKVQNQEDNIEDFIITQKKMYDSMKHIETKTQESIDIGNGILKNTNKLINKLDSVVMLMSDLNGHMENLNDNLNILTQVIASKTGIELVENE